MAKQIGEIRITGTVAGITFYQMDGQYYARRKSSLEGKRVKKDPRFRRTMQSARRLGRGSQLASGVYRSLPKDQQGYSLFCTLKTAAIQALKEGRGEEEVLVLLEALAGTKDKVQSPKEGAAERKNNTIIKPLPHTGSRLFVDASGRLVGENTFYCPPAISRRGPGPLKQYPHLASVVSIVTVRPEAVTWLLIPFSIR